MLARGDILPLEREESTPSCTAISDIGCNFCESQSTDEGPDPEFQNIISVDLFHPHANVVGNGEKHLILKPFSFWARLNLSISDLNYGFLNYGLGS